MIDKADLQIFEARRPFLVGLAYRMLGSVSEVEDVVQDTFVKWTQVDHRSVENPVGWLTSVCTRRCIDMLRAARASRVEYVGAWIPEPIQTVGDDRPDKNIDLASSLSLAFVLLLQRLAPKERAAYVLREVFGQPYNDVATALGVGELACRKLVSRAKHRVGRDEVRAAVAKDRQHELMEAFQIAIATGEIESLARLMAEDVMLQADGGGKVPTALNPILGKDNVRQFVGGDLCRYWQGYSWRRIEINGGSGALVMDGDTIVAAVAIASDVNELLSAIFVVRNPDKLIRISTNMTGIL